MKIVDGGILHLSEKENFPKITPRRKFIRVGKARDLKFWILTLNTVAGITRVWKLFSPNGKQQRKWTQQIQESSNMAGSRIWRNWWNLDTVKFYPGRWTFRVFHDNEPAFTIPVDVIAEGGTPIPNRAPNPPEAVLIPSSPKPSDVVACRVSFYTEAPDPDIDLPRYRYKWSLDGKVLRDATTAAHLDYFPADTAPTEAKLTCEVYRSDGILLSKAAVLTVYYR